MNEQVPTGDEQEQPFADLAAFDVVRAPVRRLSRNGVLAVAAGAVVACAVGGGFFYVSSDPTVDVASAAPTSAGLPRTTDAPTTGSTTAGDFVVSGHDVFDNTVAPEVVAPAASSDPSTVSRGGTPSAPTGAVTSAPVPTTTVTSRPASGGKAGTKPVPAAPVAPVAPPVSRSTAPAWEEPKIVFEGPLAGGVYKFTVGGYPKTYPTGTVLPGTSTVFVGSYDTPKKREMTQAESDACKKRGNPTEFDATVKCTVLTETVTSALFTPTQGPFSGWYVAAGAALPDAALGKTVGTLRDTGLVRNDKNVIQVGDTQFDLTPGEQVPGTTFVWRGEGASEIDRSDVAAFTGSDGSLYFTVIGGGEDAGVLF